MLLDVADGFLMGYHGKIVAVALQDLVVNSKAAFGRRARIVNFRHVDALLNNRKMYIEFIKTYNALNALIILINAKCIVIKLFSLHYRYSPEDSCGSPGRSHHRF